MTRIINELEEELLTALATYTFLTAYQAESIVERSNSVARVQRHLREMSRAFSPLVGTVRQSRLEGKRYVYYLTSKGAHTLSEKTRSPLHNFNFKEGSISFSTDYHHRLLSVEAHMRIKQSLEKRSIETRKGPKKLSLNAWHTYFHKTRRSVSDSSSKSQALITESQVQLPDGKHLIPDVNMIITEKNNPNVRFLAILEVTRTQNLKRIIAQIHHHISAMKAGTLADRYDIHSQYRVLFLCESPTFYQRIITNFRNDSSLTLYRSHFLFACIEDFFLDPLGSWVSAEEPRNPINFITGR